MKGFKQFGLMLLTSLVGLSVGMVIMWGVQNVSASEEIGHEHPLIEHAGVAASCGIPGLRAYWECPDCNLYFSDPNGIAQINVENETELNAWRVIPALQHETDAAHYVPAQAATCTHAGHVAHYECIHCGACFTDEHCHNLIQDVTIPQKEHHPEFVAAKAMTCSSDGWHEHYVCRDCGQWFKIEDNGFTHACEASEVVIKAHHHSIDNETYHVAEQPATCLADGHKEYYVCVDCGEKFADLACTIPYTEAEIVLPRKAHFAPDDAEHHILRREPTCEEDGNIEYWICEHGCGEYFANQNCTRPLSAAEVVLPKLGHDYGNGMYCIPDARVDKTAVPYRHVDGAGELVHDGTDEVLYYQHYCPRCGKHEAGQQGVYGFAELGRSSSDNNNNLVEVWYELGGENKIEYDVYPILIDDATADLLHNENGYDLTIEIEVPSNCSQYSKYQKRDENGVIFEINTQINTKRKNGRDVFAIQIHFDEDELMGRKYLICEFDWDGDGYNQFNVGFEQKIRIEITRVNQ